MRVSTTRGLVALALLAALGAGGCVPVVVEGAKKYLEDRSTEDQVTDTKIKTGILTRLTDKDKGLLIDVNVDVWEQRLLLTGTVDDPAVRREVVALARQDNRLKALYDEIQVVSKQEQAQRREEQKQEEESGTKRALSDAWISAKIEAQLIAARGVTSVNYRWRTVRKQVYLVGRARSAQERDKVFRIIRETEGVQSLKHWVEIKPVS